MATVNVLAGDLKAGVVWKANVFNFSDSTIFSAMATKRSPFGGEKHMWKLVAIRLGSGEEIRSIVQAAAWPDGRAIAPGPLELLAAWLVRKQILYLVEIESLEGKRLLGVTDKDGFEELASVASKNARENRDMRMADG